MMKLNRFAAPLIAVAMMTVPMMALAQSSQQGNAAQSNTTNAGSMNPESQAAQAYRDGVESATIDMAAKRPLDPLKSFRYTHPPVKKGPEREAYLSQFAAGYQAHLKAAGAQGGE